MSVAAPPPESGTGPPDGPLPSPRRRRTRRLVRVGLGLSVGLVAIQFVPYGWWHSNPPVTADAPWPTGEAAATARTACYACHSNETDWPPYSYVAPMSWLVRRDVERGRDELNFSEWDGDQDADDAAEAVADGSMPPDRYVMLHPDARSSDAERRQLIDALNGMERDDDRIEDSDGGDDDEDRHDGRGDDD
jgi:hypothetical protein